MNALVTEFEFGSKIVSCPACESSAIAPFIATVDYHYGIEGLFQSWRCSDCQSAFMNPMPSVRDLEGMYGTDYYAFERPEKKSWFKRVRRAIFRYPRLTSVPHFAEPGTMLDFGCGAGQYMLMLKQEGWQVYGSELNEAAAEKGREAGLDIRGGELMDAGFDDEYFDFVRSNHSFEHLPNPEPVLKEMRRILKDDGKLFIGIPNFDGWMAKIFKEYWWYFCLPVHPVNYSQKGITSILERNGFKVEKIIHNSDSAGLIGSLQIWLNARRGERRSNGWLIDSHLFRIPVFYAVKIIDAFRGGDCMEVICSKA